MDQREKGGLSKLEIEAAGTSCSSRLILAERDEFGM